MERNENGLNVLFEGRRGSAGSAQGAGRGNGGGVGGNGGGGCSDSREGAMQNGRENASRGGCMGRHPSGDDVQLAMVYAPFQCFRMTYAPENALMRGTLFEELDKPLEEY